MMANKSNDEINLQIGTMLRKARESKGLLQSDMCETTGLTKNHISAIERGISKASVEMLLGYCKKLNMTPNDILEYSECPIDTNLSSLLSDLNKLQQEQIAVIIKSVKNFADVNRIDQVIYESEKEMQEGGQAIDIDDAFEMLKAKKNADYLSMIDKSMAEAKAGGMVMKTIDELEEFK